MPVRRDIAIESEAGNRRSYSVSLSSSLRRAGAAVTARGAADSKSPKRPWHYSGYAMFGLSQQQSSFQISNRCPLCEGFPIIPSYAKPDGTPLSGLVFLPLMD